MSKDKKIRVNKVKDSSSTMTLFPEVETNKVPDVTQENEKPILEATTLWDYPRQSYGKTPKGDNKFQGVTPAFIILNLGFAMPPLVAVRGNGFHRSKHCINAILRALPGLLIINFFTSDIINFSFSAKASTFGNFF